MMAGPERLLRVDDDLDLLLNWFHSLPAGSDDDSFPHSKRLNRLCPLAVPILIGHRVHDDVRFGHALFRQPAKRLAQMRQMIGRPMLAWPIETNRPTILPGARNRRIAQQT